MITIRFAGQTHWTSRYRGGHGSVCCPGFSAPLCLLLPIAFAVAGPAATTIPPTVVLHQGPPIAASRGALLGSPCLRSFVWVPSNGRTCSSSCRKPIARAVPLLAVTYRLRTRVPSAHCVPFHRAPRPFDHSSGAPPSDPRRCRAPAHVSPDPAVTYGSFQSPRPCRAFPGPPVFARLATFPMR
jgi:hypothetical protein